MDTVADAPGGAKPENGRERPPEPAPYHYYLLWDPRSRRAAGRNHFRQPTPSLSGADEPHSAKRMAWCHCTAVIKVKPQKAPATPGWNGVAPGLSCRTPRRGAARKPGGTAIAAPCYDHYS